MPEPIPDINRDHQCYYYQAPTGQRCGSPALKGEYYCYHHHLKSKHRNRVLIDPEITCMEIPVLEDRASIFAALAAVLHRLAENTIDTRRSGQMIYGLQALLRALPPEPAPSPSPSIRKCHPERSAALAPNPVEGPAVAHATATASTLSPTPPKTISITKESLLYFLRSRHCYNCNAELFPPEELTERRNPGAPPEIIEEAARQPGEPPQLYEEIHRELDALHPPALPAGTDEERSTDNAATIPALHAVAAPVFHCAALPERHEVPSRTARNAAEPTAWPTSSRAPARREQHEVPRFALHSPRRSVSLRLARMSPGILVSSGRTNSLNQKANRRTKWQQ